MTNEARGRGATLAIVVLAVAAVAVAVGAAAVAAAGRAAAPVTIEIRNSRFLPASLEVPAGRPITFVIHNDDPIDHEWIVGDEALHARHRTGTEATHDARPTEVTIEAGEIVRTTVTFRDPGTVRFVCHLPGHEAYGMTGTVVVR